MPGLSGRGRAPVVFGKGGVTVTVGGFKAGGCHMSSARGVGQIILTCVHPRSERPCWATV